MKIPAIFAEYRGGRLLAAFPPEGSAMPESHGNVGFSEAASLIPRDDSMSPAVVVDTESILSGSFDEGVVKEMRIRGADIWFMTCVRDADDLMDAFNTTAEMVMAPAHLISDEESAKDILSMSDCVMPAIMVSGGKPANGGIALDDVGATARRLESLGFCRLCVWDSDGSVPETEWERLADSVPSAVPFVPEISAAERCGFQTLISPLRPPAPLR